MVIKVPSLYMLYVCMSMAVVGCQQPTLMGDDSSSDSRVEVSFASNRIQSRVVNDEWESDDVIGIFMFESGGSPSMSTLLSSRDGQKYTSEVSSNTFAPATENDRLYYPSEGNVDFIGYCPYSSVDDLSLSLDISRQQVPSSLDLLYSNNLQDIAATKTPLSLSFSHQLCKLTFHINRGEGVEESDLADLAVFIDDLPIRSSFSLLDGGFTPDESSRDRLHGYVDGETVQFLVYPESCAGKEISVMTASRTYVYQIASPSAWQKGYHYSYTITLDKYANSTSLSGEIVPWITEGGELDEDSAQYPVISWDGAQSDIQWYDESKDTFELSTPSQLCGLSWLVSAGHTFEGKTVMLTRDMNLNGYPFPSIGADRSHAFYGVFDGQGHAVNGIHVEYAARTDTNFIALFGVNRGTIKRLTTMGSMQIESTSQRTYVAGLVAYNEGEVENCDNYMHMSVDVSMQGENSSTVLYIGGLAGSNLGSVRDSRNRGRLIGNHVNANRVANTYVGGVVGQQIDGKVSDCVNYQSVEASGTYVCVGGICGYMAGREVKDSPTSILEGCLNYGDVISSGTGVMACAGGVVGNASRCYSRLCNSSNYATIQSSADQSDTDAASGGIVGFASHCYFVGNTNMGRLVTATNTANEEKAYGGGLAGMLDESSELHTSVQQPQANVQATGACGGIVGFLDLTCATPSVVYGCNVNKGNPLKWIGSSSGSNAQSGVTIVSHSEE